MVTNTYSNADGSHYAEWKKPDIKEPMLFHLYEVLEQAKLSYVHKNHNGGGGEQEIHYN